MTTARRPRTGWRADAVCAGSDTDLFFGHATTAAMEVCSGCPVRAECLHDALAHETYHPGFGVWGGLTVAERRELAAGLTEKPVTIAALRQLLDEIDTQGGPEAARHNRLHLTEDRPTEGTTEPMSTESTASTPTAQATAEALPVGQLMAWGDEHPDTDVQDQAARGRVILAGLRKRYADDLELSAITTEAEQLEKRLAELRSRQQEIAPVKAKAPRRKVDYDSRAVRAWARETGVDCPATGRVPKAVVDQWTAATAQASGGAS
jgi:hypothetical protein